MSVEARWPGTCPDCGYRWAAGDLIRTDGHNRQWKHAECPDDPAELPAPAKPNPLCPVCWLEHPEGACDRAPDADPTTKEHDHG